MHSPVKPGDTIVVRTDNVFGLVKNDKGVFSKKHLPKGTSLFINEITLYAGGNVLTFHGRDEILDVSDEMLKRGDVTLLTLIERLRRKCISCISLRRFFGT